MSERTFHMTPAQAELMRGIDAGEVYGKRHAIFVQTPSGARHLTPADYITFRRRGWISEGARITRAGREALRQYEEGQSRANN